MNNLDIAIHIITILVLISIALIIFLVRRNSAITKRYNNFSVEPLKDDKDAIFDILKNKYYNLRKSVSNMFENSIIFKDYSKKYQKYCNKSIKEVPMDYIADKLLIGLSCTIIFVIFDLLQNKNITILQILTVFLIGFFIPDLILNIKDKIRNKRIEKDMLKAIIIMNNAFKSGFSIMQAIYTVYHELDGPISEEFRKMYIDLTFGLNTEVAFERFNQRVNNEEAKYITTSLNVLNRTGGNIVQVFASVERNAFTRKKLKEELKSLSSSANAIFKILVAIPVLLFLTIILMNPSYFNPLFTNPIGILILMLCIIIYVSYIVIIRKVVKAGIK